MVGSGVARRSPPMWNAWLVLLAVVGAAFAQEAAAQVGVSDNGQAVYAIPIPVPPGIAGHEPKVSLQYARGTAGHLAVGWSITGGSSITRCGSTVATDGVSKGVRYNYEDRFCLDGERLIETTAEGTVVVGQGGYGGSGSEYRTEKDAYTRVRAYGGNGASGPTYFKAWTKSGLTYEYGLTEDSRILTSGPPGLAMVWAVNKVSDAAGNFILYSYRNQAGTFAGSSGREWWLWQIRYTGNEGAQQAPQNRIEFVYEPGRPDASESYHEGSKTVVSQRLAHVSTFIATSSGDREIGRLKLTHGLSPNTGRSLLASAQFCGGAALDQCAPRTEFTYSGGPMPVFSAISLASLNLSRKDDTRGYMRGVYQGDFNGDGRQDLLVWDDDRSNNNLLISNGDGTFTARGDPFMDLPQIGHSNGCYHAIVVDFNLDSIADILHIQDPDARRGCESVSRLSRIYKGRTSGLFEAPVTLVRDSGAALPLVKTDPISFCQYTGEECTSTVTYGGRSYSLVDINGDGWLDLLFTRTPPMPQDKRLTPCDPGETTCLFLGSPTLGRFSKASTSLAAKDLFALGGVHALQGLPGYQADRLFIGDLNGDALPDILVRDTGKLYIATGSVGAFSERQIPITCSAGAEVLDINGDGKWDVACMDFSKPDPFRAYVNDGSGSFAYRSQVGGWAGNCRQQQTVNGYEDVGCDPWTREWVNFIAADIDGDGISDVLNVSRKLQNSYPRYNAFLKGRADGSFVPYPIPSLENEPLAFKHRQMLIGDFSGHGALEILSYSPTASENKLYRRDDATPPDLLRTVTTAGNARTTVNYRPMTDRSVYERGYGAVYPQVDFISGSWVVSSLDAPNGRSGFLSTSYLYQGQRNDLQGRGSLGFKSVSKTARVPNGALVTTQTTYHQTYPHTGLLQKTLRYPTASGGDRWVSSVETEYGAACETASTPRLHRVVPTIIREHKRDANGANISFAQTVASSHSCDGDPQVVEVRNSTEPATVASSGYYKRTDSKYARDVTGDKWVLARLIEARQTNTAPAVTFPPAQAGVPQTASNAPRITVSMTPVNDRLLVGQPSVRTWTTANATALTVMCTSVGGYNESASKSLNGSDTLIGNAAWRDKTSQCTWRATGVAGTTTVTHNFTVVDIPTIAVQLSPSALVAGQPYQVQWSTTSATAVSYSCTSASPLGHRFSGNANTLNGVMSGVAQSSWVGNPSTCTWTATGPGGSRSASYEMQTWAPVTITASIVPDSLPVGSNASLNWQSTGATVVTYSCTAVAGGYNHSSNLGASGSMVVTGQPSWVGRPSACVWTATGPGGTARVQRELLTVQPPATLSVVMPPQMTTNTVHVISVSSAHVAQISAQCSGNFGSKTLVAPVLNGSFNFVPDASWYGLWTCRWTGTGAGGTVSLSPMSLIVARITDPAAGP